MVTFNKNQNHAKIWINIVKFLVEYSVSEPINFCPLSTETFVYKKRLVQNWWPILIKVIEMDHELHDFAHFFKSVMKTLLKRRIY